MHNQVREGKRKRVEKINYDEIMMIDQNTEREDEHRRRQRGKGEKEIREVVISKDFPVTEVDHFQCHHSSTPPLSWDESKKLSLDEWEGGGKEEGQGGKEEGKEVVHEGIETEETISKDWPYVQKSWWIEYVILKKFEERLSWTWKNGNKSFKGTFSIPQELFCFAWEGVGLKKETEQNITITIRTKEEMKVLDIVFENRKEWRRKKFYHHDTQETLYIGQSRIVLQFEKIVSCSFETCSSCLKFVFEKKNSTVTFSGVVEGRNHLKVLRF
jgi:hypothetical protein